MRASPSEFREAEDGSSTTTAATARPIDRDVDRTTTTTTTTTTIHRHLVVPGDDDGGRRRRAGGSRSSSRRPTPRRIRRLGPPMAIVHSYLSARSSYTLFAIVAALFCTPSLGLGWTGNPLRLVCLVGLRSGGGSRRKLEGNMLLHLRLGAR